MGRRFESHGGNGSILLLTETLRLPDPSTNHHYNVKKTTGSTQVTSSSHHPPASSYVSISSHVTCKKKIKYTKRVAPACHQTFNYNLGGLPRPCSLYISSSLFFAAFSSLNLQGGITTHPDRYNQSTHRPNRPASQAATISIQQD